MGTFWVQSLSESNGGTARIVNPIINIILLAIWLIAAIVFKLNSYDDSVWGDSVWGYSCLHSSDINPYVDFLFICAREVSPS